MLSVLLLTYRDVSAEDVVKQGTALEQQVWTDYVTRMVTEKGNNTRYPLERIYTWLPWLARQMHAHQQTIFYAEYLQTDWLTRNQQQTVTKFATHLPTVILGGCVCLLVSIFVGGFVPNMLGLQYPLLIQLGLVGGFIGGSLNQLQYPLSTQKKRHFRQAVFICVLVAAEGITLYLNPGYFTSDMWQVICILGLGNGLSFWVFQEFLYHMPDKLASRRGHLATWFIAMGIPYIRPAATFGAGLGLSYGLSLGLTDSVSAGTMGHPMQSIGPSIGLSIGLSVLRHYVIRWLLARHHTFPFRASTFLDDATSRILLRRAGSGYSFIHRRLQDYFANAALPSIEEIVRERKEE